MKEIPIILLGIGGVGRQLIDHILDTRQIRAREEVVLKLIGVCDSKTLLLVNDVLEAELDDGLLLEVCKLKSSGSSIAAMATRYEKVEAFAEAEVTSKLLEVGRFLGVRTGLTFVDCSASSDTVTLLSEVVEYGCCVVLANKKPLTSEIETYAKLMFHFRQIRCESTVGAGLPIITSLDRILSSGDPINRIIGSLSGTLGYVMGQLEDGRPFSQVVLEAKELGFTEPDPRDDLSGTDVARKGLIMARLLGLPLSMENIKVESLYPQELGPQKISAEEFLSKGSMSLDHIFEQKVKEASSSGNVIRYVCTIEVEQSSCHVGLMEFSKESPMGRLRGCDNMVQIFSRCYKSPLVIQGPGAGNDTTAAGVLADIIDLQDLFQQP